MTVVLNPYISFKGNAEEAGNFYKSIFGGELEISRFSDVPNMPVSEEQKNQVMHATLKTDSLQLMLSDAMANDGMTIGDNISISLSGDDEAALKKYFEGLSEGGNVKLSLSTQSWGDTFGMVTDKFGIHWMVNISKPKS